MTMRRRTAGVVALVLGAAALASGWSAQAATWLPGVSVSDGVLDAPVRGPDVVVGADGTATAIWTVAAPIEEDPFAIDVVHTATRPAGAPDFGPVQSLGQGTNPDLVDHPDGSVTAAWEQDGMLWSATRPTGASVFSTPAVVPDLPEGDAGTPRLTVDGSGNVTLAFMREVVDPAFQSTIWTATRDGESGSWSEPSLVPESASVIEFDVEAAADGTVTLGWADENDRMWSSARPREGTLGSPTLVDDGDGEFASIALADNPAGVTALSWSRFDTSDDELEVAVRTETDDLFGPGAGLSGAEPVGGDVALVVDEAGRVSGGWAGATQGVVGVTRETDGTVTRTPLTVGASFALVVVAAADQNGVVTLAWQQSAGTFFVATARRTADGVFDTPAPLTEVNGEHAADPVLGVAPSGDVTVVYQHAPADGPPIYRHLRAQVLDVNAPTLTATVPATGTAGSAIAMTTSPTDLWGPVSVAWSFGDGSTATGTAASHTYAGAGSFVVRVTATDGGGNITTLERTVTVAAAPPVPPVAPGAPVATARRRCCPGSGWLRTSCRPGTGRS